VFIVAVGAFLVATPSSFIAAAQPLATPAGLYIAAVIRIVAGVILLKASRLSRVPTVLRVIGASTW
jgi:hypothetical protein